jgi:uncharacterized protein (TIGR03435 family)
MVKTALLALAIIGSAFAQDQHPAFEVASVKPFETNDLRANIGVEPTGRFVARATLRALIAFAWDLRNDAVTGGPGWMDSIAWAIEATPDQPGRPPLPRLQQMLQSLLIERFQTAGSSSDAQRIHLRTVDRQRRQQAQAVRA